MSVCVCACVCVYVCVYVCVCECVCVCACTHMWYGGGFLSSGLGDNTVNLSMKSDRVFAPPEVQQATAISVTCVVQRRLPPPTDPQTDEWTVFITQLC